MLDELLGSALANDAAVVNNGDLFSDPLGFLDIVSGEKDGDVFLVVEVFKVVPDAVAGLRIQTDGGFIKKEDAGVMKQAPRDFQTTFHAAGKGFDQAVFAIPEFHKGK